MRRRIGQAGLDSVRTAFHTTNLTTLETVLSQGFPHRWNPCTLERIYQSKEQTDPPATPPLRITLLGGSGSARSSEYCSSTGIIDRDEYDPRDKFAGRYSTILEHHLNTMSNSSSHWKVEITNMRQGGMYECCGWFRIDRFSPFSAFPICLILVNDFWGLNYPRTNPARSLGLWLHRIKSIFAQAGKPPPPIMLVFLLGIYDWVRYTVLAFFIFFLR